MPPSGTTICLNGTTPGASDSSQSNPPSRLTGSPSHDDTSTSEQSLTDLAALPPPGVEHFEARRARWLTPPEGWKPPEPSPSTSRMKLEALLASEDAVSSEEVWNSGIRNVWHGLVGGGRLRRRLPLGIVLKILQAGWLRDGTWPTDKSGKPLRAPGPIRMLGGNYQDGQEDDDVLN